MPVSSALAYLQKLLNGLPMPGQGTPKLVCLVTPPPLFSSPGPVPHCYAYVLRGRESRDKPLGSVPRNTGPGTPSGFKGIVHTPQLTLLWEGIDEQGSLFTGMIDAVMAALRTAYPNPALVTDPNTGVVTQLADTGEVIEYWSAVRPQPDQQICQFEAVFQVPLTEVIQA